MLLAPVLFDAAFTTAASSFLSCPRHLHYYIPKPREAYRIDYKKSGEANDGSTTCVFTLNYAFGDYVPIDLLPDFLELIGRLFPLSGDTD